MSTPEDGYSEIDTKDDAIRTVFDSWEKISCFIEGKQYKVKVVTNTVANGTNNKRNRRMKVKELIQQLCNMNLEADVVLEVYNNYPEFKYVSSENITDVRMISEEKCMIEGD